MCMRRAKLLAIIADHENDKKCLAKTLVVRGQGLKCPRRTTIGHFSLAGVFLDITVERGEQEPPKIPKKAE